MSWLCVSQSADTVGAPAAMPPGNGASWKGATVLPRGSLFVEADLGRWRRDDQTLFVLHGKQVPVSHASLHLGADGTIAYVRRLGDERVQTSLSATRMRLEGVIRLIVSWDMAARRGVMSLETVDDGALLQRDFVDPLPWLADDARRLRAPAADLAFGPGLCWLALSDRPEPVGLTPSLAAGTPVRTPRGDVPVERLAPGDLVETAGGRVRPVLWSGGRDVPARGRFRPIRLMAPYLGLTRDVIVAPQQRLVLRGDEVEYLFNEEAVLVEARALLNTAYAVQDPCGPTMRYHQVILEEHDVLRVGGAGMESLFIGTLRESPQILATTMLARVPAGRLPAHRKLAHRALLDYEAMTLRAALLGR